MKITMIFARRTPRSRKPQSRPAELPANWSMHDLADLPVYHPRQG